ncbi:MAG: metallophosphoesterase family protein [Caldilineaceae bacterium]
MRADVVILGHTHQPFVHQGDDLGGERGPIFVNPGAVGRSLDGDRRASCAVFNTATGHTELLRVPYDIDAAVAAIRADMPVEIALLVQNAARRVEQLDLVTW